MRQLTASCINITCVHSSSHEFGKTGRREALDLLALCGVPPRFTPLQAPHLSTLGSLFCENSIGIMALVHVELKHLPIGR